VSSDPSLAVRSGSRIVTIEFDCSRVSGLRVGSSPWPWWKSARGEPINRSDLYGHACYRLVPASVRTDASSAWESEQSSVGCRSLLVL